MKVEKEEAEILFDFFKQVYPLTQTDLKIIINYFKRKVYKKGDFILNTGQIESKTSFILKGLVHQYVVIEGIQFTIDISLAGMAFNNFTSYVDQSPSNQVQEAITDVTFLYLEKADAERLLIENFPFCYIYMKLYEQVHLEREKRSLLLQCKSSYKRYEQFLKTIAKSQRFTNEVPQKMIADYLNMTQETLSRVRKKYLKDS